MQQTSLEAPRPSRLREGIDAFCAQAILVIVLFILVWAPLAFGGMSPSTFLVIQGLTVAALALWMVRFWVQRPFRLFWPPICWAALAFLLYALARCRVVEVEYAGRQQLIHTLVYGALFFVALNNLNRRDSATLVSLTLIAVGFALSLFAIFQFAKHYPLIWGVEREALYLGRGSGTFINPNHLAGYLCLTMPLALAFTAISRLSATFKVLLAYGAIIMLAGIVVSVSRGGILAAIIGLVVFCAVLLLHPDFWRRALLLLCILTALGAGAATQFESVQRRFDEAVKGDKVEDSRQSYWAAAWQLFDHNPAWGVGPGHFDIEFPSVRPWSVQSRPQFVHNDYLNTLCEWGIVGMSLIAAACGLLCWSIFRFWQSERPSSHSTRPRFSDRTAFVVGAAVGVMAVMLHCVVEFNMQIAAEAVTAITLMALLTAQTRFVTERYWRNPGWTGKIILTAVAAAAIGYLSIQGLRRGTQTYWLAKARSADAQPEAIIAFVTKAHEIDPTDWETDYQLGEYLWSLNLADGPDCLEQAKQALTWYAKAMQLNRFDAYAPIGCGMCLDRLGKTKEAAPYFAVAHRNDPHNCYIALEEGRHCIELGDLAAAKPWMDDAIRVAGTPVAYAEWEKLWRMMSDPIFKTQK